jgi:hypothetical protein
MESVLQRFKSRTYWAAIILAALTIIEAQYSVVATLVSKEMLPYLPLIFPLAMMVLREITKTAIADK